MRKGIIAALVVIFFLGLDAYTQAQRGPGGRGMMGQGQMGGQEAMGPGMGMMGQMGQGMGMMGPVIGSPEIMGAMMSIHAEIISTMGQMMRKYGNAMGHASPALQQKMQKEMMERMGEILTQHGASMKKRAKAVGK